VIELPVNFERVDLISMMEARHGSDFSKKALITDDRGLFLIG
jgi:hypothetical protein